MLSIHKINDTTLVLLLFLLLYMNSNFVVSVQETHVSVKDWGNVRECETHNEKNQHFQESHER